MEYKPDHVLTGSDYALQFPLDDKTTFDGAEWDIVSTEYLDNYETNLKLMIEYARQHGVRVILVTMPYKYKLSPAWKAPQPECFTLDNCEEVKQLIDAAAALIKQKKYADALQQIDKALSLDNRPPILHYLRAQTLESMGRMLEAENAYAQSRENIVGNLGSMISINDIKRKVAEDLDVTLIDAVKLFKDYEHANDRYFNELLMQDDCHPSILGQQLLAEVLAGVLVNTSEVSPSTP